jgi:iron(II)-dependent oxidoreductase
LTPIKLRCQQLLDKVRGASSHTQSAAPIAATPTVRTPTAPVRPVAVAVPATMEEMVSQMLANGRYALLLRPQIAPSLSADMREAAQGTLHRLMSIVPEGEVVLGPLDAALADGSVADEELCEPGIHVVAVDAYLLDRYCVTNAEYAQFVATGGYQQMPLWDAEVWPAVLDFVDSTGRLGPRFWRNGSFDRGADEQPVVGISWYEASAYARWVGKRLPTDAEWVKAASWPIHLPNSGRTQRRFPWGSVMDREKANLWSGTAGKPVGVGQFGGGATVGGVYQMIGNVWEWTFDDVQNIRHEVAVGSVQNRSRFKSLRGGAFDTYFDTQATCHFQSGDLPLARRHNIGFRCALSVCDLLADEAGAAAVSEEPLEEFSTDSEHEE